MTELDNKSKKKISYFDKLEQSIDSMEHELSVLKEKYDSVKTHLKNHKKLLTKLKEKQNKNDYKLKKKRKPCGFARPTKVSDDMCYFLGRETGSLVSRTDVTKCLIQYIKDHQLQHKEHKRLIVPDDKLSKLFGEEAKDKELTWFTMQKYVNHHFIKE